MLFDAVEAADLGGEDNFFGEELDMRRSGYRDHPMVQFRPHSIVDDLTTAAQNERHAPDLLPYPEGLIAEVSSRIVQAKAAIDEKDKKDKQEQESDEHERSALPFKPQDLMKMEVQRVSFLLAELLRTRVRKIEKVCFLIDHDPQQFVGDGANPPLLSENEIILAQQMARLIHSSVLNSGLSRAPEPLQKLTPNLPHGEGDEILPRFDLSKHVFVLVLEDMGLMELGFDTTQEVRCGDVFLVQYSQFKSLIVEGKAQLV